MPANGQHRVSDEYRHQERYRGEEMHHPIGAAGHDVFFGQSHPKLIVRRGVLDEAALFDRFGNSLYSFNNSKNGWGKNTYFETKRSAFLSCCLAPQRGEGMNMDKPNKNIFDGISPTQRLV